MHISCEISSISNDTGKNRNIFTAKFDMQILICKLSLGLSVLTYFPQTSKKSVSFYLKF